MPVWDALTATPKGTLTEHTEGVTSVAFSPAGNLIASGDLKDNRVRLRDAGTLELKRTLAGHTDAISSVTFSPDGTTLASGSWDGTVLLWKVAD